MLNLTDHKDYICPKCKKPTDFDARFCKFCAFDLDQPVAAKEPFADIRRTLVENKILVAVVAGSVLFIGILLLTVFLAGGTGGDSAKRSGSGSSLSTSSVPTGDTLTEEEMMSIMQRRGIWGAWAGQQKHDTYEIVRVGPYNKEGKFYPVQVKVSDLMSDRKIHEDVWDCRFQKNDYGDWEVKKMGL